MQRMRALLWPAGLVAGVVAAAVILTSNRPEQLVVTAALGLVVGWSFISGGLIAWRLRPHNRVGALMVAIGFGWLMAGLTWASNPFVFTVGVLAGNLFIGFLAHLVLAFPAGRLESRSARAVVAAAYLNVTVVQLLRVLVDGVERACVGCPPNLLGLWPNDAVASFLYDLQLVVGVVLSIALIALLVRRWWGATPAWRHAVAPVLWAAGMTFLALLVNLTTEVVGHPIAPATEWLLWAVIPTVPVAFVVGVLRSRLAGAAVADLVVELGQTPAPGGLRDALARALHDPSLQLAYWATDAERYVDVRGQPVELPSEHGQRVATVVERDGHPVAALLHDRSLREEPGLVQAVCSAAILALENERLQAVLRARLEDLARSRARMVEAADAERRRIERNLHDGTQQRLVSISMMLGLADTKLAAAPEAARAVRQAKEALGVALEELRALSHGIHPAILTERGLGAALQELSYGAPLPVEVRLQVEGRLPEQVEAAVYYVAAEALANVVKHAGASAASVDVTRPAGQVVLIVADDGVGGAQMDRGSGLLGLADRVEALGGRLRLTSPPGGGTVVRAEIPCG
jgi:signal transduction histidine kinase